jgi:outer membrane murein-binding lipoprotein Lpp
MMILDFWSNSDQKSKIIIELEAHVDALRARVSELQTELQAAYDELHARPSTALVVWRPR